MRWRAFTILADGTVRSGIPLTGGCVRMRGTTSGRTFYRDVDPTEYFTEIRQVKTERNTGQVYLGEVTTDLPQAGMLVYVQNQQRHPGTLSVVSSNQVKHPRSTPLASIGMFKPTSNRDSAEALYCLMAGESLHFTCVDHTVDYCNTGDIVQQVVTPM